MTQDNILISGRITKIRPSKKLERVVDFIAEFNLDKEIHKNIENIHKYFEYVFSECFITCFNPSYQRKMFPENDKFCYSISASFKLSLDIGQPIVEAAEIQMFQILNKFMSYFDIHVFKDCHYVNNLIEQNPIIVQIIKD